ncbi:hypothetical protein FRB97_003413, partial [Tulasnella sp. 331]
QILITIPRKLPSFSLTATLSGSFYYSTVQDLKPYRNNLFPPPHTNCNALSTGTVIRETEMNAFSEVVIDIPEYVEPIWVYTPTAESYGDGSSITRWYWTLFPDAPLEATNPIWYHTTEIPPNGHWVSDVKSAFVPSDSLSPTSSHITIHTAEFEEKVITNPFRGKGINEMYKMLTPAGSKVPELPQNTWLMLPVQHNYGPATFVPQLFGEHVAGIDEYYIALGEKSFTSLGLGSKTFKEAFIDRLSFKKLMDSSHDEIKLTHLLIPMRNGEGQLRYRSVKNKESKLWAMMYDLESTAASQKPTSHLTRYINPKLDLWLLIQPEAPPYMAEVIRAALEKHVKSGKLLQSVSVHHKWDEIETIGKEMQDDTLVQFSTSPFGDFKIYILESKAKEHLEGRADRKEPTIFNQSFENLKIASPDRLNEKCKKVRDKFPSGFLDDIRESPTNPRIIHLSASRIRSAAKKRDTVEDQGTVMGRSATDVAEMLGWSDYNVSAVGFKDWPATAYAAAEWLHLCAFSWGGIIPMDMQPQPNAIWESSQVAENLVFGTSETNSVMTRYEKAWQTLFLNEEALRNEFYSTGMRFKDEEPVGTLKITLSYSTWFTPFWIPNKIVYKPSFDTAQHTRSEILDSNDPNRLTREEIFYPFRRPFFTMAESIIDAALMRARLAAARERLKGSKIH